MGIKAEGIWPCTVISANYGEDAARAGITRVQICVTIDSGPSAGQFCAYEDDVTGRSALYVMRSAKNVGWKGGPRGDDLSTLAADCAAWIKETGGKALVEIKHIEIKNGKRAGEIWDKANSIRRGAAPLKAPSKTALDDAREAIRRAMEDEGTAPSDGDFAGYGNASPPRDGVPHAASSVSDNDIPF